MKEKIRCMQRNSESDKEIISILDDLDEEETSSLLENIDIHNTFLGQDELKEIRKRTLDKLNIPITQAREKVEVFNSNNSNQPSKTIYTKSETGRKDKFGFRKSLTIAAAAVLLFIIIVNHNSIGYAFQRILSFIPGVGILENNQEILYRLKDTVTTENELATLTVNNAIATNESISVIFEIVRKNYTEEELKADKEKEWENLKNGEGIREPRIYLQTNGQKFKSINHSYAGGGPREYYNYYFEISSELINPLNNFKLVFEDLDIEADFRLVTLEQYSSLNDIGTTAIHNNISLTATANLEDNKLKVHVYPLNYSGYTLISFDREYEFNYFNKKMTLKTDKGDKTYTLPDSYGSGINAAYTFDLSDGANYSILSIPYVVVESAEEKRVTLPIPQAGEVLPVNKEVVFEEGSVLIKDVEKIIYTNEDETSDFHAELKVNLEYKNSDQNKQLVGVDLTNKKSEGKSWELDEDNRVKTFYYMLNDPDKDKIKLYLTKPRYVLMEEYKLDLRNKDDVSNK